MKHDLSWFEERIGREVVCKNPYTKEEKYVTIEDDGIDYHRRHLYQDCGYTFKDPIRVHSGPPDSACISCEG